MLKELEKSTAEMAEAVHRRSHALQKSGKLTFWKTGKNKVIVETKALEVLFAKWGTFQTCGSSYFGCMRPN